MVQDHLDAQKEGSMSHSNRIYLTAVVLLLAGIACAVPGISIPDSGGISTAAVQTAMAALTQNAPQILPSPTLVIFPTQEPALTIESPTLPPTETNIPTETSTLTETVTPTQTLTLTPVFTSTMAFTPTQEITTISVSVATNCRTGPGKVYPLVGALLVGKTVPVYARDTLGNYWYIRNPDINSDFCWVWGGYATVLGPSMLLPVFTPPPTPTSTATPLPTATSTPAPDFKAEYVGMDSCAPAWWGEIKLKNTGSIPFKSVNITVNDKATDVVLVSLADGFTDVDGCLKTNKKDVLGIGDTYLLSAPAFAYNPNNHNIRVTIILCTDTGQKGLCVTKKFKFKP
jgi:hypothetical protein